MSLFSILQIGILQSVYVFSDFDIFKEYWPVIL